MRLENYALSKFVKKRRLKGEQQYIERLVHGYFYKKTPSYIFDWVLDKLLATLLLANRLEPCKPASQIEEKKQLSRGDRLLMNSP